MKHLKMCLSVSAVALIGAIFSDAFACLSGGEGATSCSHSVTVGPVTTSSSVSCGTGYYACCNATSASCKPNPSQNPENPKPHEQ